MATDVHHPVFARFMSGLARLEERAGGDKAWRELLDGVGGRGEDVGPGNGVAFVHYPSTVTEVLAVEPEEDMRAQATEAAASAPGPIRGVDGLADSIPAEGGALAAAGA